MKLIILLVMTLLFSGCNFGESKEEIAAKRLQEKKAFEEKIADSKEVQLKKIDAQKEQELAKIESQTTLAKLEKEQLLEKIRLEAQAQKEKIMLEQAKEKAANEAKLREIEHQDSMEIKRYLLVILFLILVIASYFIYLYFRRRHDDKLRAYQDNLDKYFHQQENMTKMRIAEKIIDTVASGELDKEQQRELIKALSGNIAPNEEPKLLTDEIEEDVEIVEEKR
ncbi:hypothetical protein [Sulfurimonas paralvinellae]|uniref:Uncharacterized protein n=1 Tax=Sulfurimonas paralvinellae TaxID=317658 RepID=A0A7M1B8J6_9BACT|nr:hypothetical protein [Sulfurimonas paralvinellae]QOP45062.1 hypothetical protein FM071_01620 [Sulfurimonas paralvinellae]